MANKILIKSNQTTGHGATQLFNGGSDSQNLSVAELAINTVDGILFAGTDASAAAGTLIGATTNVFAQPLVVHTKAQALGTDSDVTFADITADAFEFAAGAGNTLTASGGTLSIEGVALATVAQVDTAAQGLAPKTDCACATTSFTNTTVDTNSSTACDVDAQTNIEIGMLITGAGIPVDTYVTAIDGDTLGFTISNAATATATITATFTHDLSANWTYHAGNGTLTWATNNTFLAIDGYTLLADDRILVKNQGDGAGANGVGAGSGDPEQDGIYYVSTLGAVGAALVLTRVLDMNASTEFPMAFTFVSNGTDNADTSWVAKCDTDFAMNSTAAGPEFVQFNSAGTITAGSALTKTGNTLSVSADSITEAMIDSSNSPTNDYVLTADSGEGGGLKWAAVGGGDVIGITAGDGIRVDNGNTSTPDVHIDIEQESAITIVGGDQLLVSDANDSNNIGNTTLTAIAALFAGDDLTAATGVIGVDDSFVQNDTDDTMVGTLTLDKNHTGTTTTTIKGEHIDVDVTGVVASGQTLTTVGLDLDITQSGATMVGILNSTGIDLDMVGATSGTQDLVGLAIDLSGSDTATGIYLDVPDGQPVIKMVSSADATDYATLTVGASGATALTTVDAGAAIANLTLTIDGSLIVAGNTGIDISAVGGVGTTSVGLSTLDNVYVNGGAF